EDLGDREALALLDRFVDVHGLPAEPLRQRASDRRLAGAHEADEINLVRFHDLTAGPARSTDDGHAAGHQAATSASPWCPRWSRVCCGRAPHWTRRSSVSKNPGYETSTASAPSIRDGCSAPS